MRKLANLTLAFALCAHASLPLSAHEPDSPSVETKQGWLQGTRQGEVDAFLGIPFAAPPVGDNRWRAPQPLEAWGEPRDAKQFGANCIQPLGQGDYGPWTHEYVVADNFSEDCLFLNIWRPADAAADAELPVFVWIHGGGFVAGSGSVPIYEGRNLATKDMVVVTINYRLGALGFLSTPELTREAGNGINANFGLQDQLAALRWVKGNIAAFGGDADNITVAGQSAGAVAVHSLVASPLAKGLFQRAVAHAGLPVSGITSMPLSAAEENGRSYMEQLGQQSLAEMRALPADRFLPQPGSRPFRFGVVIDGVLLASDPRQAVRDGSSQDIPLLVGQNADESLGGPPPSGDTSSEDWEKFLSDAFGSHAQAIGALYPSSTGEERTASLRQIQLDRAYADIWLWGGERGGKSASPLYVYLFDHIEPGPDSDTWRSFHSNELPFFFGTLDKSPERGFTFEDWDVSQNASDIWVSFARTGVPGTDGFDDAPQFDATSPERIRITDTVAAEKMLSHAKRAAYAAFVADGGRLSPMFR